MTVNILSPLYARWRPVVQSFHGVGIHHAKQKTASALGHFSAHHLSVSPLRGTPMTEKWMTEKCAQSGPDRGIYLCRFNIAR
jgi:hypothetical protein